MAEEAERELLSSLLCGGMKLSLRELRARLEERLRTPLSKRWLRDRVDAHLRSGLKREASREGEGQMVERRASGEGDSLVARHRARPSGAGRGRRAPMAEGSSGKQPGALLPARQELCEEVRAS